MPYNEEEYWIVFNGEIFNFLELKMDLSKLGHKFRTTSDTEVILAAYIEWGEKCVEHFNGMWAFCLFDKKLNSLFLSRDRFGIKPLHLLLRQSHLKRSKVTEKKLTRTIYYSTLKDRMN